MFKEKAVEGLPADIVELNPRFFRPKSKCKEQVVNFVLTQGGIGDYICFLSAIRWVAENQWQVKGRVYCPDVFVEIVENVLRPYAPRWRAYSRKALDEKKIRARPTYMPLHQPINGTGMHLVDLGFIYYTHNSIPAYDETAGLYCQLDLSAVKQVELSGKYAVMTPGSTYANRTLPAKAFNGIKDHLLSKGITPVFLGTHNLGKRKIHFEEGYDYSGGIDLRDKTTLLQAAGIISKAELIVGLDNGLLHLAAMTEVPIIFGYNIASPEHRRPRRKKGTVLWEIWPNENVLKCTFCQSQMRFIFNHDFAKCMYEDMKCLEMLGDPAPWCELVDKVLNKEVPQ